MTTVDDENRRATIFSEEEERNARLAAAYRARGQSGAAERLSRKKAVVQQEQEVALVEYVRYKDKRRNTREVASYRPIVEETTSSGGKKKTFFDTYVTRYRQGRYTERGVFERRIEIYDSQGRLIEVFENKTDRQDGEDRVYPSMHKVYDPVEGTVLREKASDPRMDRLREKIAKEKQAQGLPVDVRRDIQAERDLARRLGQRTDLSTQEIYRLAKNNPSNKAYESALRQRLDVDAAKSSISNSPLTGSQVVSWGGKKPSTAGEAFSVIKQADYSYVFSPSEEKRKQYSVITKSAVAPPVPASHVAAELSETRDKSLRAPEDFQFATGGQVTKSQNDVASPVPLAGSLIGYVSEAKREPITIFGKDTGVGFGEKAPTASMLSARAARLQAEGKVFQGQLTSAEALGVGFLQGSYRTVFQPIRTTKAFVSQLFHPITSAQEAFTSFRDTPEAFIGEALGQAAAMKGIAKATPQVVKNQVPRFTVESASVPTDTATINVQTFGLQQGTRGTPLITLRTEVPVVGPEASPVPVRTVTFGGTGARVVDVAADQSVALSGRSFRLSTSPEGKNTVTWGETVRPRELAELSSPVPTSVSVGTAKAVESSIRLLPEETTRIRSASKVSEQLQLDRGMRVREPVFNVRDIPENQRAAFSTTIDKITGEEGGVFFGSGTTQQLPKGHQNVVIGDVDVFYPKRTSAEITEKIIPRQVEALQKQGIVVQQSATNKAVIETPVGAKILEAKSGVDPEVMGEELALAGFSGVKFADIKAGQTPDTVPFGSARAITAGEQTARKGAASSFINPPIGKVISAEVSVPRTVQEIVSSADTKFLSFKEEIKNVFSKEKTYGYFDPNTGEIKISRLQDPIELRKTILHETVHSVDPGIYDESKANLHQTASDFQRINKKDYVEDLFQRINIEFARATLNN